MLFVLAAGVYIGVWAINKYAANFYQTSYYYKSTHNISASALPTNTAFTDSLSMDTAINLNSALTVSMTVLYPWILWKGPLFAFLYAIIEIQ